MFKPAKDITSSLSVAFRVPLKMVHDCRIIVHIIAKGVTPFEVHFMGSQVRKRCSFISLFWMLVRICPPLKLQQSFVNFTHQELFPHPI